MNEKSSSYLLIIIITLLSIYINKIEGQSNNNNNTVPGRAYPGCALLGDKLYCYGGFTGNPVRNTGLTYSNTFTDHLELDLSVFDNFTIFNTSKIQWKQRPNIINESTIIGSADMATTTLSDGTYIMYGGRSDHLIDFTFSRYDPSSDTWTNLSLPDNNTYYLRSPIVNIGHDRIWIFGGDVRYAGQLPLMRQSIYDFNTNTWPTMQTLNGSPPMDHTSTLVDNTIYIIGGLSIQYANDGSRQNLFAPFNCIITFNTIDSSWGNFTATGDQPSNRCKHTAVLTSDSKYIVIYGGVAPSSTLFVKSADVYFVFDVQDRSFKYVQLSNPPQSNTPARFGHYATIYKSNYLLLAFGYNDLTSAADNLNVLSIENVFEPSWVSLPNNTSNSTNTNVSSNSVNINTVVPAVVVPVTIALLGIAIGAFLFIRHRKKKQQKAFVLEQEDPRRTLDHQNYGNLIFEEDNTTAVIGFNRLHYFNKDFETENSLMMNDYQNRKEDTIIYGKADLSDNNVHSNDLMKPFEANLTTKPFES